MEALTAEAQLADIREEIVAASEHVRELQAKLSADDWLRRPAPDSWSAVECIEHINITNAATLQRIDEGLKGLVGKPRHRGPYHLDLFGWLLIKSLSSRSRFSKSTTKTSFVPKPGLDLDRVLTEFFRFQAELLSAIERSVGVPLDVHKMQSVFESKVKYNLYSALRVVAVHETRHLDQAERAATAK